MAHNTTGEAVRPPQVGDTTVSVIVPVYNRQAQAVRAIKSVLEQEDVPVSDLEIVVADDASSPPFTFTNDTPVTKIVRLPRNKGAPAARNAAIASSTGAYLAFLDSDDVWLPGKLKRQLEALQAIERAEPKGLHAAVTAFYCPNRLSGAVERRTPVACRDPLGFASGCWFNPGSTLLISRAAFEAVGPFDEQLRRLEDYEWFLRFARAGGSLHVIDVEGAVIAPSGSATSTTVSENAKILMAAFGAYSTQALLAKQRRRMRAYLALERSAALLAEGRAGRAAAEFAQSLILKPRLRPALEPFWRIDYDIPGRVRDIFAELTTRT